MGVSYIGVRHHSPACARLVADTIKALRPAFVLIEGPSDFNERIGELFLGHRLPIALFSSGPGTSSFSPFCGYSPEWAALSAGRAVGARTLFIDLPAWHPAFETRSNRYADAELRYGEAMDRLGAAFQTSNPDALWDGLFEVEGADGLAERLRAYFELLRGESRASEGDEARERYMAAWIRAAVSAGEQAEPAAGGRRARAKAGAAGRGPDATASASPSVVVVTGGFHMPAIRALAARSPEDPPEPWPTVPVPEPDEDGRVPAVSSFLVPYSFRRLDAFTGYQSGMPSPEYYQRLWEDGPEAAAAALTDAVVTRLRERGQPVSTADLIAARTQSEGLAALRGHAATTRTDLLDGLASALVSEDLDQPLPWSRRGMLLPGAHPAVVEMVAALSGSRVGRLHRSTPAPPLVHDVTAELERLGLTARTGTLKLRLPDPADLERSRVLHRLRVLHIPGYQRRSGPDGGLDPADTEEWTLREHEHRTAALIEVGALGATLTEASTTVLEERATDAGDISALSEVLFDTVLCGLSETADRLLGLITTELSGRPAAGTADLGPVGRILAVALGLWRHDRIFQLSRSPALARIIAAAGDRVLWLAQLTVGQRAAAEPPRLLAVAALRDAVLYAEAVLGMDRGYVTEAAERLAATPAAPPDLRGAALGLLWSLGATVDAAHALPGGVETGQLGDWLAGLFALAREQAAGDAMVGVLDRLVTEMAEEEFLVAVPSLRMAFAYFPPREREAVARRLLERRGLRGSGRALLRGTVDPAMYGRARTIELKALGRLAGTGLVSAEAEARIQGVAV